MKEFKKYYIIPAEPEIVFAGLTNPNTIKLWTGEDAVMSTVPGSEFSLWGDSIVGKNISFEEGKKIVQQWYFEGEPLDSIVTITLHPDKKGTSLEVRHTNIPEDAYDDITEGWDESYMKSLQEFYEEE